MKFGYWTPIFGGWLRNVDDERMPATFAYTKEIAQTAERVGFDLTLVPELNLNDIKGPDGPVLDAWSIATALAAVTERIEIMAAVRPSYHPPALAARQSATIQDIASGRFVLNVVSAWWAEEARQYGVDFRAHDDRYRLTEEYVDVLRGLWTKTPFDHAGDAYGFEGTHLEPKPAVLPPIYAGGESEAGRNSIARFADAYVTHGGAVSELTVKIADMKRRRELVHPDRPFQAFGMAGYAIVRDTEAEAHADLERITDVQHGKAYDSYRDFVSKSQLDVDIDLRDYSVSNRGLRPDFVGTPEQVAEKIRSYEEAGVSLLLLQFSPQLEEMQRFGEQVIPLLDRASVSPG